MIKYRVHEVAKDFKTTSKVVTEILTKYAETPKNHMQVLTDRELNIIFDYLTLNNQISDMAARRKVCQSIQFLRTRGQKYRRNEGRSLLCSLQTS